MLCFVFRVDKLDEMKCLISGCNFLLKNIPNECFTFDRGDEKRKHRYNFQNVDSRTLFPYLLVNIGSGVSILKVSRFIFGILHIVISLTSIGGASVDIKVDIRV